MISTNISFSPLSSDNSFGPNEIIILCGESSLLQSKSKNILKNILPNTPIPNFLDSLLSKSCNSYSGSSVSLLLDSNDKESYKKLSFLRIPSVSSRHNSPTRPDVIYEKLPSLLSCENNNMITKVSIIFVLPDNSPFNENESSLSFSGALGRSCRLYTRKKESMNSISIHARFFSSITNEFLYENDKNFQNILSNATQSVRNAAFLVDKPCNECNTSYMVQRAQELVKEMENKNISGKVSMHKCCIGDDLDKEGFGGIYGVGKAAVHPPALVVLKYEPNNESSETIVWVGKGIVYDTGGLSMKTKTTMPGMKRDMGGSAAILEAFRATCNIGCNKTIYAILCLAENAVGRIATRPDDIHKLYSGVTVEINNTDAEGRLVVGDGVAYASKHLNPDVILDMCTLTGAQGIATGQRHAAILCNDESIETSAVIAGRKSGDMCHPVPYCPELFKEEFKSYFADMKNSVKNRNNAQVSCAGHFIGSHLVDYENKWIHVDMASPSHKGELATGYGVLLLLQLFILS